jgi:tetratricopeptide (TPR) repeat protein
MLRRVREKSLALLASLVCAFAVVAPGATGTRADDYSDKRTKHALVIGIASYDHGSPLKNPVNDVTLIGKSLASAGFTVKDVVNPSSAELKRAVELWPSDINGADIAFVYYAGHAAQIDGENYLIPSDFDPKSPEAIDSLVPVRPLLNRLTHAAKVRVLLLDACRNNPFKESLAESLGARTVGDGLASIEVPVVDRRNFPEGTHGMVVGYATQPQTTAKDGTGANSFYAAALGAALEHADAEFTSILRRTTRNVIALTAGGQRPEYRDALTGPFYLVSRPKPLDCDVLAAETDNDVLVKGVEFEQIDVAAALPACEQALEANPDNPRLMHNLGRVLERSGRLEEALGHYKKSAEKGYDWGQVYYAVCNIEGTGTEPDMKEGAIWLRKAFEQGNRQAMNLYTGIDLWSSFRDKVWRVKILQKALREASIDTVAETGEIDAATREGLEIFMHREGIEGSDITLQVLDRLNIVEAIWPKNLEGK